MAKIGKGRAILLNPVYHHPSTNLLVFRFEPVAFEKRGEVFPMEIDGKAIYVIDHFFTKEEGTSLREYTETATFSNPIYGSKEALLRGEKPALGMNSRERWELFSKPPKAIDTVSMWLGGLAQSLEAEVTLVPWDLCDGKTISPAIATNFLSEVSIESQTFGIHEDTHPEEGLPYGLPILYQDGEFHPAQFTNGEEGRPWLVSLILYVAAKNWEPNFGMGTVFYRQDRSEACVVGCIPMRLVFFEGDLLHSIQASIPGIESWRASYVFKLALNPKQGSQRIKGDFLTKGFLKNRGRSIPNLLG